MLPAGFGNNRELLFGFQLGTAGADDVESAGVAVLVDVRVVKNQIVIVKQTAGAALEAVQDIILIGCLQRVVQAADNVVAAGRLAAGQNHTDNLLLGLGGVLTLLEGDFVLAVGVGEERLDLFLVSNTLGCAAVLDANLRNTVSEHAGQLGIVLIS